MGNNNLIINCLVRPSKILLGLFTLFIFLLIFSWAQVTDHLLIRFLGVVGFLALFVYTAWRHIFLAAPLSWIGFQASVSPLWTLISRNGVIYNASLRKDTQVLPGFILLRFDVEQYSLPVTLRLFKDSLSPQEWRQLHVLLYWGCKP